MTSTDDGIEFLAQMKKSIEESVLEQARRHAHAGSHADWGQVVDIQIGQERERLVKFADKMDDDGHYDASQFVHNLIDDYLPFLAKDLRNRR